MDEELLKFAMHKKRFEEAGIGVIVNSPPLLNSANAVSVAAAFMSSSGSGYQSPVRMIISVLTAKGFAFNIEV